MFSNLKHFLVTFCTNFYSLLLEGTPSGSSEAAAIKVSEGQLIVEKQKFPPNLTIAIARIID